MLVTCETIYEKSKDEYHVPQGNNVDGRAENRVIFAILIVGISTLAFMATFASDSRVGVLPIIIFPILGIIIIYSVLKIIGNIFSEPDDIGEHVQDKSMNDRRAGKESGDSSEQKLYAYQINNYIRRRR